jgi:hypothetical protein
MCHHHNLQSLKGDEEEEKWNKKEPNGIERMCGTDVLGAGQQGQKYGNIAYGNKT